ncbi:hypothetical protein Tco_1525598 [Tanacetum coccineum]
MGIAPSREKHEEMDKLYDVLGTFGFGNFIVEVTLVDISAAGHEDLLCHIKLNLKKCYADEPLVMPLEGIHVDDKLQFVEEPVEIMEREIKRLKRSRIPLVKVRWNSRRGPEFTWEREDSFKQKYPQLFTNRASSSTTRFEGVTITLKAWFECARAQRFVDKCDDALGRPSAEETSKWLLAIVHQTRIQSTNLLPCRRETVPKSTSQQGWQSSSITDMQKGTTNTPKSVDANSGFQC